MSGVQRHVVGRLVDGHQVDLAVLEHDHPRLSVVYAQTCQLPDIGCTTPERNSCLVPSHGLERPGVAVGGQTIWAGRNRVRKPLRVGQDLLQLRDAGVPGGHRQRPGRKRGGGRHFQRVVVKGDQALGLGDVTVSQLIPALNDAERLVCSAPGDAVQWNGAVFPVCLYVTGGDRRSILKDSVLAERDGPNLAGLVYDVASPDVWAYSAGIVDLADGAVDPSREDSLAPLITPWGNASVAVRYAKLLPGMQLDARRSHRCRVDRKDRRQLRSRSSPRCRDRCRLILWASTASQGRDEGERQQRLKESRLPDSWRILSDAARRLDTYPRNCVMSS